MSFILQKVKFCNLAGTAKKEKMREQYKKKKCRVRKCAGLLGCGEEKPLKEFGMHKYKNKKWTMDANNELKCEIIIEMRPNTYCKVCTNKINTERYYRKKKEREEEGNEVE